MPPGQGPMIRRRRLGEALRDLREAKGYTLQALAGELGWSHTKLSRLENAKVRPDVGDVLDLLELLGVTGDQERRLIALARQANTRGWWKAFSEMPQRQAGYAELESSSTTIEEFAAVYIPGLLQTEDYARVRFSDREGVPDFDVEAAVRGRVERQRILSTVTYKVVVDEGVLRRQTAPPDVMAHQLVRLVEVMSLPSVDLRVLPFTSSLIHRPLNSFVLYHTGPDDPDIVTAETETSDVQLGDLEDVSRYVIVLERIKLAALDHEASTRLIQEIIREK